MRIDKKGPSVGRVVTVWLAWHLVAARGKKMTSGIMDCLEKGTRLAG
jgi:hypothetical protein